MKKEDKGMKGEEKVRARDICVMYEWCVKKGEGDDAGEEKRNQVRVKERK